MDELKSKSQKKREADALQKIGVKLVELSVEKLDTLNLPPHLRQAIIDAKSLKSHGAVRRQAQLIGKLMRTDCRDDILAAYENLCAEASAKTTQFHEVEVWRAKLIDNKDALTEFIATYQPSDIQQLRQLIKKAVEEQTKEKHTGASKALFRYLRSCIE